MFERWRSRKRIPRQRVRFLGFATLDPVGRVFEWEGGIYRGVYAEKDEYVRNLFACGLVGELVAAGLLVETELTDLRLEGFSLVLRHKRITAALPVEWTAGMLRDAALVILEVNAVCNRHGYELKDAHPYNVSFDGMVPRWIDLGSIGPRHGEGWPARREFVDFTIVPLAFLARGELLEGYSLLAAERCFKVGQKPFRETFLFAHFLELVGAPREGFQEERFDGAWIRAFCGDPVVPGSTWSGYQHGEESPLADLAPHPGNRFKRFFRVAELVGTYARGARGCVDLGGNVGLASMIVGAAHPGMKMVSTDADPGAVERSYALLRANPSIRVESYLLNFMLPMTEDSIPRFRSDLVLALAVTHHLLLAQGHRIEEVFEKVEAYANRWVFMEFMPLGMWAGDPDSRPEVPGGYTRAWFEAAFARHFELLHAEVIEAHAIRGVLEPHRVLFVGRVRRRGSLAPR